MCGRPGGWDHSLCTRSLTDGQMDVGHSHFLVTTKAMVGPSSLSPCAYFHPGRPGLQHACLPWILTVIFRAGAPVFILSGALPSRAPVAFSALWLLAYLWLSLALLPQQQVSLGEPGCGRICGSPPPPRS